MDTTKLAAQSLLNNAQFADTYTQAELMCQSAIRLDNSLQQDAINVLQSYLNRDLNRKYQEYLSNK